MGDLLGPDFQWGGIPQQVAQMFNPSEKARPPHSPTPVPVPTVSGVAGSKANYLY